ncbi:endonuclease/exonuclease/phosphatase family protein [Stieleria sp. ICT_E10.1]|uniref:endonuclease/exonuclease/phosphatase family protein n=1 Tax=Stieleria sedimenti TaxID=2976331 RepID=UPI0021806524|nr:endonuclease/exonuclease/phosphatase family protein [Stieleria sedimenti]MCS7467559.1 endonuclease/exonuclease/phosphatase family protein [Stieleria sedimenti]
MNEPSDPPEIETPIRSSLLTNVFAALARLACLAVVLVTVATLFARWFWVSDLLANLRTQQWIAIVAVIALCTMARQSRFAWIAAVCFMVQFASLFAQLIPDPMTAPGGEPLLRVMTMNVLTSNRSYRRVLDEIREVDPDVVAILELSRGLDDFLTEQLSTEYPHALTRPQDQGNFGIGVYGKHPFASSDAFELNEYVKSIEVECLGYRLIATHPLPPMGARQFRSRNEHLHLLGERIHRAQKRAPEQPIIVMGDLNVTPWSPHFGEFERRSGLRRARQGLAITPTWYAGGSRFPMGLVLDHILISRSLECASYRVGPDVGSDHRSVSVQLKRLPDGHAARDGFSGQTPR